MKGRRLRCCVFLLAVAAFFAAGVTPGAAQDEPAPPEPRTVEIETSGGGKLAAEVSEPAGGGETKPAVVAIHGEGSDPAMWKALAERLVECGITFVAIHAKPADPEGAAQPTWTNCVDDALAAVRWARGTLLADGKKIMLIGSGAGGNVAVAAARKDAGVRAALVLGPLPGAGGVEAGVVQWDARPLALVAGAKSASLGELKKMASPLAKKQRAETILVEGAAGHGADLLAGSPDAVLEVAQWIHGWLGRPVIDGTFGASNVRESSGPGHIVAMQSSCGCGMGGGGGISLQGQRSPQSVDAIGVLVDPDPTATKLTERSRRLTITPGKGKALSIVVKVERWTGKSWKAEETLELSDCGGFGKDANVAVSEIWLPPRVLGVKPFSSVAVTSCFVDKGKFSWKDDEEEPGTVDLGHFGDAGGVKDAPPFKTTDPSSWGSYRLR